METLEKVIEVKHSEGSEPQSGGALLCLEVKESVKKDGKILKAQIDALVKEFEDEHKSIFVELNKSFKYIPPLPDRLYISFNDGVQSVMFTDY